MPRPARSSRTTSRPAVPSARSTTAAVTSTSPCTGRRSWRSSRRMPTWPRSSPRSPRSWPREEQTIVAELNAVQGHHAEIGGYYRPERGARREGHAPLGHAERGGRRPALSRKPPRGGCHTASAPSAFPAPLGASARHNSCNPRLSGTPEGPGGAECRSCARRAPEGSVGRVPGESPALRHAGRRRRDQDADPPAAAPTLVAPRPVPPGRKDRGADAEASTPLRRIRAQ